VFTGMGSSFDACEPAVTELCGRGIPAQLIDASELLHFRQPILAAETFLVVVSQSGESAEVVRLAGEVGERTERPFVLTITNGLASGLVEHGDVALDTRAGPEAGPSTMTFAASVVVLSAVARLAAGDGVGTTIERAAAAADLAAAAVDHLLVDVDALSDRMVDWLGRRDALVVVGRGAGTGAADMAALLFNETGTFAESLTSAAFRHGPFELAGPGLAVVVVASEPRTRALDLGLARELVDTGASVLVITPDGDAPEGVHVVATEYDERLLSPLVSVVPLQLLAWRLAARAGRAPGEFTRATKVTTRE
jgi:glucosamine--fructose-6-phosphate aminotransferase (isomerizing)